MMFSNSQHSSAMGLQGRAQVLNAHRDKTMGFAVEDAYWGYVIRSTARTPLYQNFVQGVAFVLGLVLLLATLGLWLLPDSLLSGPVLGLKFGASTIASMAGWYFLWYASRGTRTEVHVDTRLAEVREVVTNRVGRPTLLSRHGFDAVAEVAIDIDEAAGPSRRPACLVIRNEETSALVRVASGSREALDRLRQKLGRDLMVAEPQNHPSPYDIRGVMMRLA